MAGRCRIRLVDPPNAACVTMALRTRRRREDVAHREAARFQRQRGARRAARHVQPDRDGRRARAPNASATCRALRRPPATWPRCPGTGSRRRATRRRGTWPRPRPASVICPWAKRAPTDWTLPGVLALLRQQRHAAGNQHARADRARRPAPSSSRAALCRRWPRRSRRCAWAASGSGGRKTMAASLR